MDLSLLQALAQMGAGFVIAGIVLMWKRSDDARYASELADIITRQQLIEEKMQSILLEQTKVLEGIRANVEQLGRLSRIEEQLRSLHDHRKT